MAQRAVSALPVFRFSIRNAASMTAERKRQPENFSNGASSMNAFITAFTEALRKNAAAKTEEGAGAEATSSKPLRNMSFAVKDNFCVSDFPTTCASKMLQDFRSPYDATVVQRIVEAGGVPVGKTNLDEFGMGSGSVDSVFGPVKNPWNDQHIAGGSSGGSAVAVATGAASFALGSDTGGSVRNPASYCGVVGFKPSYGSVSRHGLIPLINSTDVPSVFSTSIHDVRTVFQVLAGWDPKDSTTFYQPLVKREATTAKHLRVGIPKQYNVPELDQEVRDWWMKVADGLEQEGAVVREISLPHSEYSNACYTVLNACEVASNMARYDGIEYGHRSKNADNSTNALYAASRHEGFNNVVRGRILAGNFFLLKRNYEDYFLRASRVRRLITQDFSQAFENEVDVILTPVTLSTAPSFKEFTQIDNRTQQEVQDLFTVGASLAGVPAVSVPVSLSKSGLPMSLQLIAPFREDFFLLSVAKLLETFCGFDASARRSDALYRRSST